jgi:hypothetical protein
MFNTYRARLLFPLLVILGLLGTTFSIERPAAAASGPALSVNAAAGQRPIDPMIYGMNFACSTISTCTTIRKRRMSRSRPLVMLSDRPGGCARPARCGTRPMSTRAGSPRPARPRRSTAWA